MFRELTTDEITTFNNDGVLCVRGALSQCEVEGLRRAVDTQISHLGTSNTGYDFEALAEQLWSHQNQLEVGEADLLAIEPLALAISNDPHARPLLEEGCADKKGMFLYESGGWRDHAGIRRVAFDSSLPSIAASLLGSSTINFWQDTTFVKAPYTKQKTAFHQDIGFTQIDVSHAVVPWIPLDPANLDNGVTEYVRGSHKWGQEYAANMLVTQTPMPGSDLEKCPDIEGHRNAYDIVSFEVEPGDVIFHHILTIHGAGGNMSDRPRRAISFRYCGDQVRYYDRPGAIPQDGQQQPLKNGDLLHSTDYPLVYPKPWPDLPLAGLYELSRIRGLGGLERTG